MDMTDVETSRKGMISSIMEISLGIQQLAQRLDGELTPIVGGVAPRKAERLKKKRNQLRNLTHQATSLMGVLQNLNPASISASQQAIERLQTMERDALLMLNKFLVFLAWLGDPDNVPDDRRRKTNRRNRRNAYNWQGENQRNRQDRREPLPDDRKDRRKSKRVPYNVSILFFDDSGRMFSGTTHDLSVRGLRVILKNTPQGLETGNHGHVGFPSTSEKNQFACRVAWRSGQETALEIIDYRSQFGILIAERMMQQSIAKQLLNLG